jgi:hypothetical protein
VDGAVLLNRMRTTDESNTTPDLVALAAAELDSGRWKSNTPLDLVAYVLERRHAAGLAGRAEGAAAPMARLLFAVPRGL